jgi:asparagine synthase (glutamine-hydrolysing)
MTVTGDRPCAAPDPEPAPDEHGTAWTTDTAAFWALVDGRVVWASGTAPLRELLGARLDHTRLALSLCPNLPGALRRSSFWPGITMVPPGCVARDAGGRVHTTRRHLVPDPADLEFDTAAERLDNAIDSAINHLVGDHGASCDISGGIDSTALAYYLARRGGNARWYHAGTADRLNRDTGYARRAAADLGGEWVELPSFTTTSAAFTPTIAGTSDVVTDGPPSWSANSVHLRYLFADAAAHGVRVHLNGLGGDELFTPLPAVAKSLLASGHRRLGIQSMLRLFRTQRWPLRRLPGAALSEESYGHELRRRIRRPSQQFDDPGEAFAWSPGFASSAFFMADAHEAVVAAVDDAVDRGVAPASPDRARHQTAEALQFQGEVVRQVNAAYASLGVRWAAPLLDDAVTSLVLALPHDRLRGRHGNKPLLAAAAAGTVPDWVFSRPDKGEYSADLFAEYRLRRDSVREVFTGDSYLIDVGIVDPDRVRDALAAPTTGTGELFELEQLALVERWAKEVS